MLDDGVGGFAGDATVVVAVAAHLDVSLGAPARSPRVLHQEVI